jgi:hypothetical protein
MITTVFTEQTAEALFIPAMALWVCIPIFLLVAIFLILDGK